MGLLDSVLGSVLAGQGQAQGQGQLGGGLGNILGGMLGGQQQQAPGGAGGGLNMGMIAALAPILMSMLANNSQSGGLGGLLQNNAMQVAQFATLGFSRSQELQADQLGVQYESVDVLQDMEIRQGIKEYSDWPTIPQLYVNGEFLGGSDIMMEMFEAGELQEALKA